MKTIEVSCGDIVPINQIDAIGKIKPSYTFEPVYVEFLFFNIYWKDKKVISGYEFLVHTVGNSYFWICAETESEATQKRDSLLCEISIL